MIRAKNPRPPWHDAAQQRFGFFKRASVHAQEHGQSMMDLERERIVESSRFFQDSFGCAQVRLCLIGFPQTGVNTPERHPNSGLNQGLAGKASCNVRGGSVHNLEEAHVTVWRAVRLRPPDVSGA